MEKNNNSSSSSSVCTKIRHALASNSALRAIHRISSFNQEPKPVHVTKSNGSNSPSPPPRSKTTSVQTKPPPHHKAHTETSTGAIPIKFDYSTPIEHGNSEGASTHHVGNSTKVAAKGEPPQHGGDRVHSEEEQQGKESVDINDTFKEFIQRVKKKMRTVSNIGRGQSQSQRNPAAAAPDHQHDQVHHGTTKNENLEDTFQDFIHRAKKKIRTTTLVGKTGSLGRD